MSDELHRENPVEEPEETVSPAEAPAEEAAKPPAAEPTTPPAPPVNSWSADGSYRYVPPRTNQTPPPPVYSYYSPTGGAPVQNPYVARPVQPPVTPPPAKPHKKNGWMMALSIFCALCVVVGVGFAAYELGRRVGDGAISQSATADGKTQTTNKKEPVKPQGNTGTGLGENAPSLEISGWDNTDGGLSDKEIVKRNYASTVLLTSYVSNTNYGFGESALVESGAATGIVMTADGYIITNWHCVINEDTGKPYERIDVTVYGGETYEDALVIGADESTDLAVIHVEATDLTPAQFGDSAQLEVGDRVLALGNAAGLGWSASRGIVSAVARDVYEDTGYAVQCLQVDAAINPGNSGGPLLNNQGMVIGINSAKISATDYEGIGFSIPINEAKGIIESLLRDGYVKGRVALGITGQTIATGIYEGFVIYSIEEGSSFDGTEVEEGDLIVAVNDETVTDYSTLRATLAKYQVGDTVELTLLRADRRGQVTSFTVEVVLQEQKNITQ